MSSNFPSSQHDNTETTGAQHPQLESYAQLFHKLQWLGYFACLLAFVMLSLKVSYRDHMFWSKYGGILTVYAAAFGLLLQNLIIVKFHFKERSTRVWAIIGFLGVLLNIAMMIVLNTRFK